MMTREISAREFERNIFELSIHGADENIINKLRKEYYSLYPDKKRDLVKKELPSLKQMQKFGFKINKPKR